MKFLRQNIRENKGKKIKYEKNLNILIIKYRDKKDKNDKIIEKVKCCHINLSIFPVIFTFKIFKILSFLCIF